MFRWLHKLLPRRTKRKTENRITAAREFLPNGLLTRMDCALALIDALPGATVAELYAYGGAGFNGEKGLETHLRKAEARGLAAADGSGRWTRSP